MRANLYRLTVGLSYLLAGLWFGSLVGFVITAIRVFATVRAYEPGLADSPEAGAVPAGQAPDALAGAVTRFFKEERAETLAAGVRTQKEAHSWTPLYDALEELARSA
jgi:hypothetical protein